MNDSQQIVTLKSLIEQSRRYYSNRPAFYLPHPTEKHIVTYTEFADDINALGTALMRAKKKGKHIGIIGKNSYEWAVAYLAVVNGVGVVVPLDKELTEKELCDSVERVKIDTLFYSSDVAAKVLAMRTQGIIKTYIPMTAADNEESIHQLITQGKALVSEGAHEYQDAHIDPNAVTALLFTSGTTSQSKIVMLSHRNITTNVINGVAPFQLTTNDKFLSILPIHHMFECVAGFLAPIYSGASIYFSQGLRLIRQELKEQHPTVIVCVPRVIDALSTTIWKGINEKNMEKTVNQIMAIAKVLEKMGIRIRRGLFSKIHNELGGNIRFFLCGAASINPKTAQDMLGLGFTIYQGYGLTECSPAVSLSSKKNNDIDSVGTPIADTSVLIHEPDEDGNGEILVKGPQVMLGYYNDAAATKSSFYKGYFKTGDIGHIKENGNLKIVGRLKNVIVTSGGKNIYPEELEALVLQCPAVKDVVVHGTIHNQGMQICATILLADADSNSQASNAEAQVKSYIHALNEHLAPYERINTVKFRSTDFVRTSTLKIKRYQLGK